MRSSAPESFAQAGLIRDPLKSNWRGAEVGNKEEVSVDEPLLVPNNSRNERLHLLILKYGVLHPSLAMLEIKEGTRNIAVTDRFVSIDECLQQ